MKIYDMAIIGTGPAGVSAAITATIRNKNIVLFGTRNLSDKIRKAHLIQNYPGLPKRTGTELCDAFADHLDKMRIEITEQKINMVYAMGDKFALQTMSNEMYQARSVILASGMVQGSLLPGEEELVGRGVSYCATCDAPLYRGRSVAVIGYSPEAEKEANFLSEIASEVRYFPLYQQEPQVAKSVEIMRQVPRAILNNEDAKETLARVNPQGVSAHGGALQTKTLQPGQPAVETEESVLPVDGIFVLRSSIPAKQLIPGIEMDGEHVKVNLQMETSLPGCFACGDVTGRPYQYVKAAGQGNVAALSAAEYLDREGGK